MKLNEDFSGRHAFQLLWKFILIFFLMTDYNNANAQPDPTGKTYTGRVSEVCKKMAGGGCVIYTFCVLQFEKESVDIYYYMKAFCTPKEREKKYDESFIKDKKTYSWTLKAGKIIISGFDDYGAFEQKKDKLVGQTKKYDEVEELDFVEQILPSK